MRIAQVAPLYEDEFLGHAYALLFPIDWPEPFGLAMIEAMACETPIIAYRQGSVPEMIEEGHTGFIVNELEDPIAPARRVPELSRQRCREMFEKCFTARPMAHDYLEVYKKLIEADRKRVERSAA